MAKYYFEIDSLSAKSDYSAIEDRISSKNDQTIEIIDEKPTKKASFADLLKKDIENSLKERENERQKQKSAHFRELYGSRRSTYSVHDREKDLVNIIDEIDRHNAYGSSIVLDARGKRAIMDPNVAFKKKKGKKSSSSGFWGWTEQYKDED